MTAVTHRLSWIPELTQPILKRNRVLELSHCVLTACSYQLMYFLINPKYVNYTERAIYWLDISHHLHLHILTKHGPGPLGSLWSGQLLASSDIEDDLSSNQNSCRVKLRRLQLLKRYPQEIRNYYHIISLRVQGLWVDLPALLADFMMELAFSKKLSFTFYFGIKIMTRKYFLFSQLASVQ